MNIRNKVRTGTLFLFILLLLTAGLGIFYVVKIKNLSRNILKDNYESLEYCHAMQKSLLLMTTDFGAGLNEFSKNLKLQEGNITEEGEKEATVSVRTGYESVRKYGKLELNELRIIGDDLNRIIRINLDAINSKSLATNEQAKEAVTVLSVMATLVLIIGLVFTVNFPSLITVPIGKLKLAVGEISRKNYSHRVHLNTGDEFTELAQTFNSLAERLEMYEHSNLNQLMFEKSRAESVINSLKDASIGIESSGKVLFANKQSLALLNLTASEIVGKDAEAIASSNDLFRYVYRDAGSAPFKIVAEGKENYFITERYPVAIDDKEIGYVIALKNITSFQEKDTAKTNFLATISHELKTPLGSADLGLKLLANRKTGELNEMQREIVHDLQMSNARLLKLVSELLDMSQAETGNINLNMTEVDLGDVIDEVTATLRQQASEREISITTQVEGNIPCAVADKEKAAWVIINLISNSIRYSPERSGIVVAAQREGISGVSVSVIDNGPGIPVQYRDKIFRRFFKVPDGTGKHKGTGLGLSISKEFVEAMGGSIEFNPSSSGGSHFKVTFRSGQREQG